MVTPLQQKIFEYIESYIEAQGYSPSLVEIAKGIGISPKSVSLVSRSIHALVDAGRLRFAKKGYRNLQIVEDEHDALPLVGRIAAGSPIEAIEDQQTINLCGWLGDKNHFALQVRGDSMVEEGIFDGDYVVCRQARQANEGDIVVALVDGNEATLKRISFKGKGSVTLIPANPAYQPQTYLPGRVDIQGIYVGLLRFC